MEKHQKGGSGSGSGRASAPKHGRPDVGGKAKYHFCCGNFDHYADDCRFREDLCCHCGKQGHVQKACLEKIHRYNLKRRSSKIQDACTLTRTFISGSYPKANRSRATRSGLRLPRHRTIFVKTTSISMRCPGCTRQLRYTRCVGLSLGHEWRTILLSCKRGENPVSPHLPLRNLSTNHITS